MSVHQKFSIHRKFSTAYDHKKSRPISGNFYEPIFGWDNADVNRSKVNLIKTTEEIAISRNTGIQDEDGIDGIEPV